MLKVINRFFIVLLIAFSFTFCADQNDETEDMQEEMTEHSEMQMTDTSSSDQEWVREGEIDLKAIDENGDGMVYQDPMDWNVISDEPGVCPVCGMDLKEVSLEEARANLVENGYQVKE